MGGVHGDYSRPITGQFETVDSATGTAQNLTFARTSGCFGVKESGKTGVNANGGGTDGNVLYMDTSLVVPTASAVKPRAWGALACVYLGQPAS